MQILTSSLNHLPLKC